MAAVLERPQARLAHAQRDDPHAIALRVADEQLRFWRAQGLGNRAIFAELGAGHAPPDCSRDDVVSLIAARWLGVAG
jgi:hypothetical protein